jgi:hypothetical protein
MRLSKSALDIPVTMNLLPEIIRRVLQYSAE